jgi:hypothetical protein
MMQLLKLDGIEAEGGARAQRKAEVHEFFVLLFPTPSLYCRSFVLSLITSMLQEKESICIAERSLRRRM